MPRRRARNDEPEVHAAMAQREYEQQPEAPDLGASVQLENSETLEGDGDGDGLDAGYVPPDRPYGLDDDGVTGRGMRDGDTLDQRLRRERGEDEYADPDRAGRLTIADEGAALETPDAMEGVDVGIDGGAASAEEAAVHEVDEWGGPLEAEPSLADAPALDDPELDRALGEDDPQSDRARDEAFRDLMSDEVRRSQDPASGIDADPETGGASAPASGRPDVGPGSGL